jgi:DNA-binding transcriptional MerR regulator
VEPTLTIGDFSRATHLSVKMLRHYHDIGLLEPAGVVPGTGYRRYSTGQIATAQVIRRFRDLDMPLDQIQAVLAAPDSQARSRLIYAHLARRPPGQSGIATPAPSRDDQSEQQRALVLALNDWAGATTPEEQASAANSARAAAARWA